MQPTLVQLYFSALYSLYSTLFQCIIGSGSAHKRYHSFSGDRRTGDSSPMSSLPGPAVFLKTSATATFLRWEPASPERAPQPVHEARHPSLTPPLLIDVVRNCPIKDDARIWLVLCFFSRCIVAEIVIYLSALLLLPVICGEGGHSYLLK